MMRKKLGFIGEETKDEKLIMDLLTWMHKNKVDYTNTFCFLMNKNLEENKIYNDESFLNWKKKWQERLKINSNSTEESLKLMGVNNPLVIPRNHKVEEALEAANSGNLDPTKKLIKILEKPYEDKKEIIKYQSPAPLSDKIYKTFCGT